MSEIWKKYWPVYKRLEDEFCEFTFYVNLEDKHSDVYSVRLCELLLRICSECENIAKSLLVEYGYLRNLELKFPNIGKEILSYINDIEHEKAEIVFPYHSLTKTELKPLFGWSKKNPNWYKDYNDLKHNRVKLGGIQSAKYASVLNSLSALYILNVQLIMRCKTVSRIAHLEDGSSIWYTKLFRAI
jgi:hypothetical protein